ncbi:MAG TPA: 4Fe-4S dicluster domain-containing protein [Pseudolabrys sp.]|nr:4Fe-4S dicluster domain-containing protein [Pseudolabrys sp.]
MPLDADAVRRVCPSANVVSGRQFCRAEAERFRAAANDGSIVVACTQESPLFTELAEEQNSAGELTFVNIRETAGWSKDSDDAGPKMAALIAAAAETASAPEYIALESDGVVLIYGKDEQVIEAAQVLKDHLDVTVLIDPAADIAPLRITEFPVVKGKIRFAKGYLGKFEVTVDDYASPRPSSRGTLTFGDARNGALSRCDILIDLSGGKSLFPAADLRDGYVRADPADPATVLRAVIKARDLVGTFDKPRYVNFTADICAHSRSKIVGCHRCLDLCPTGAIAPDGDHVAIDAGICAGCGQCAAACPTGAAAYALPPSDALLRKLRTLLGAYHKAGGKHAIILFHDETHGGEMISALAHYGDGLPANVLPVAVNEVTQVGLESIAASFAYGASAVRFLLRARPRHDVAGLRQTIAFAEPILGGLGFAGARLATIETDDPDTFGEHLHAIEPMDGAPRPARFSAVGGKREVMRLSLRELHGAAPAPIDIIPLPNGAPFGAINVDVAGCTLCLSCVSACPTGALSDDPERPMLRFAEDACVQCGLCKATCPEKVITLQPQIDFRAATAATRIVKQEEPFLCIRCGEPFGTRSSVERVVAKLEGKHWMYKDSKKRLDVIKMCADCRVQVVAEDNFDPSGAPQRPAPRTTDDYLREREPEN